GVLLVALMFWIGQWGCIGSLCGWLLLFRQFSLQLFRGCICYLVIVAQFFWIRLQVIELRPRCLDELESIGTDRAQRGPAEAQRVVGLAKSNAVCGFGATEIWL